MVMQLRRRYDRATLARPLKRPDGSMLIEGFLAAEGVLDYETPEGDTWREYVPAGTLQASVADLVGRPVTMEHPPEDVTPDNYDRYAVGTVVAAEWDQEEKAIRVTLSIMRRDILNAVDDGKHELSPGYLADVDETPAETGNGSYDAVQTGREYNHVAIVEEARGGPKIRARVDSARHALGTAPKTQPGATMNPHLLALCATLGLGADFSTDDEAIRAARKRYDAMTEELATKDAEIEKMATDTEGVEKIDADDYKRLQDQNGKLMKMVDSMMSKMETDAMKPMMDAYGVEAEKEDRADDIYAKIVTKIIGKRCDAKQVTPDVKGWVKGHYAARGGQRMDGVSASRAAWEGFGEKVEAGRRTDSRHGNVPNDDIYRPGPSAIAERRYDAAYNNSGD